MVIAITACAAESTEATGSTATASQTISLPERTASEFWVPKKHDGGDIWPTEQGIRSTQVMIKRGPDTAAGDATFTAFVVWNGNHIGRIFRVRVGDDGANFRSVVAAINNTRTFGTSDRNSSSTGNATGGGGTPLPHPNVGEIIQYSPAYLANVRSNATVILDATADFISFNGA